MGHVAKVPRKPVVALVTPEDGAEEQAHKRAFLRLASHELRTPLSAIIGFSEMIACEIYGPVGAPQYKEYAELVRQSGLRLLTLVNQTLDMMRLESGAAEQDLRPEALDLALGEVLEVLGDELTARGTRVVAFGDLPMVRADRRGLRTVLHNLIQNACRFGPHGGEVTLSAVRFGPYVELTIADRGPGVDPADIPRIMAPFEQGESVLTRTSEGAGLGLPIARLQVRAMGGALRLEPGPGGGLAAVVTLPGA